jgi:chromosome segregation ATPase
MGDTTQKLDKSITELTAKVDKLDKQRKAASHQKQDLGGKLAQLHNPDQTTTTNFRTQIEQYRKEEERLITELLAARALLKRTTAARDKYVEEKKNLQALKQQDRAEYDRQKATLKKNVKVQLNNSRKSVNEKVAKLTRKKDDLEAKLAALDKELKAISTILGDKKNTDGSDELKSATKTSLKCEYGTREAVKKRQRECQDAHEKNSKELADVLNRFGQARKRQAEVEAAFAAVDSETQRYDQARLKTEAERDRADNDADYQRLKKELANMAAMHKDNVEKHLKTCGVVL